VRWRRRKTRERYGALTAIRLAHSYPIFGCWVQPGWRDKGLATVAVARRQPDGRVAWGDYLVDYYCLGVKNCFCNGNAPLHQFLDVELPRATQGGPAEPISPELAHELIYGSIEYAARWGFEPHPDYDLAQAILDLPDRHPRSGGVTYGKDGKPFFINGPDDDVDAIMAQLQRTAGPCNYDFLAMLGGPDMVDAADLTL
jgi:hypothetical protein